MATLEALILFDIDGTLLKTGDHEHGAAFRHAFERVYGRPVTLEGVPLAGMLDAQIARILFERHGLPRDEADQRLVEMMDAMGERYAQAIAQHDMRSRLLPGVVEAVLACARQDWPAGVLTGNGERVGHAKLRATGLDSLLTFGAFGDMAVERGHLVDVALNAARLATGRSYSRERTVLVGDTPNDIAAARQAGTRVIAVATGRFDEAALASHEPDALLPGLVDTDAFTNAVKSIVS